MSSRFYKPSEKLEVGFSEHVEGEHGLFATHPIFKDSDIGLIRVETNCKREGISRDKTISLYRVEFGGYGNHNDDGNCRTVRIPVILPNEEDHIPYGVEYMVSKTKLVADRDIKPGEEITWPYTLREYDKAEFINR